MYRNAENRDLRILIFDSIMKGNEYLTVGGKKDIQS